MSRVERDAQPEARLVPITREQRTLMENLAFVWGGDIKWLFDAFCTAWDDAPADPNEAVRRAIGEFDGWVITGPDEYADIAKAVLTALGPRAGDSA